MPSEDLLSVVGCLYCDGMSANDFGERLYNVIYPVYNVAHDNGFKNRVCREAL